VALRFSLGVLFPKGDGSRRNLSLTRKYPGFGDQLAPPLDCTSHGVGSYSSASVSRLGIVAPEGRIRLTEEGFLPIDRSDFTVAGLKSHE